MIGLNRSLARSIRSACVAVLCATSLAHAGSDAPRVTAVTPEPPAVTNGSSIDVIRVTFSEPVNAGGADVELRDLSGGPLPFQATYDAPNNQLVIDLVDPVENGYVTLTLLDTIRDLDDNRLDGETGDALAPVFPTGNGLPGGVMSLRLVEFSGDVTLDGSVNFADLEELLDFWGAPNDLADFDGNGFVDFGDLNTLLDRWGTTLTTDDGTDPVIAQMMPAPGEPIGAEPDIVTLVFSEAMDPGTIGTTSLFLLDHNGNRYDPFSVDFEAGNTAANFVFSGTPQRGSPCGSGFTVHISNSMADPSGRPLLRDLQPPTIGSQVIPDPPFISHTLPGGVTTSLTVPVMIETFGAASVEISGPSGTSTVPVTASPMSANLTLMENRANVFVFTAISPCGDRSTPTTIELINDRLPPELFVDFPVAADNEGAVVHAATTDLQGRIGDLLSGFQGLSVHVLSDAGLDEDAAVNIGIGTNGTWFISGADLLETQKTTFFITATDVVGNSSTLEFAVRRGVIDTTRARFVIPADGGNNQAAQVHSPLPAPIKVQVLKGNGTPFVNKLVTFTVTRSDGMVASPFAVRGGSTPGRMRQVRTDQNGFAQVFWITGGDAGMGNNRVTVSSMDIQGTAVFCASALPGDPFQINIGSGNNQVGEVNSFLPMPLRAFVSDSCNGVSGVPVTFEVIKGNGRVNGGSAATVNTGVTGHAEVSFRLGAAPGTNIIRANYPGNPNGPAEFVVRGVQRGAGPTTFAGVVQDNAFQPIRNALCALQVNGAVVGFDYSDDDGRFVITGLAGAGPARLHVSGASANAVGGVPVPLGTYPALYFEVILVPGIENSIAGPILLPALNPDNRVPYSLTEDTILTVEGMEGLRMIIKPGSMYMRQGGPPTPAGTLVSLNQVHHDDIPMPMPDGAAPPFAWTLQPAGAYFDPPVIVEYPNMSGLPPGSVAYFLTFNHDTGEFEIVSTGTVSDDGSIIRTDPGDGLNIAGWGCNCPPYSVTGECKDCEPSANGCGSMEPIVSIPWVGDITSEFVPDSWYVGVPPTSVDISGACDTHDRCYGTCGMTQQQCDDNFYNDLVALCTAQCYPESIDAACDFDCQANAWIYWRTLRSVGGDAYSAAQQDLIDNECCDGEGLAARDTGDSIPCPFVDMDGDWIPDEWEMQFGLDSNDPSDRLLDFDGDTLTNIAEFLGKFDPWDEDSDDDLIGDAEEFAMIQNGPFASVNETWEFKVGAQTVAASTTGAFRISNISAPDLFGANGPGSAPDFLSDDYLRVTGFGKVGSQTWYAYSEPFQIERGSSFLVDELVLTPTPPPFPELLRIQPAPGQPTTITAIGGISQMQVIGVLADDSEIDVTPRTSWTTYRTSNPAVATVGPDGLVTAHSNGPVFITAMNEGATATIRLIVSLGDPLTTVEGFVLTPDEQPVPDAVVSVLGQSQSAMTNASGFFSIPGVATTLGNINVRALSPNFIGVSGALEPVPGGITDAGIVDTQEAPDTSGREFFLVFQPNLGGTQLSVFISSSVPTAGQIEAPGFIQDFLVQPGLATAVTLPSSLISSTNDGVHNLVARVTADADIVVYGLNRVTSSTDAFASLPVETYGTSYRAMGYSSGAGGPSQLAVVAAVDGTTVTVTPKTTLGSRPAGVPFTVQLNRLQAYQLRGGDVTGTLITADAPIGVFAGAQCTNIPVGVLFCDHLCEQMPPTTTWGRDVITLPIQSRLNGDTFRILAHSDNTTVTIDGPAPEMFTLNAGDFAERILEGNNEIFADRPILVAQYSNSTNYDGRTGDPFMMLVPPAEQFLAEYTFLTPTSGFTNNFVNIIARTVDAEAGAVNLDGVALDPSMFQTVGDGFYSCAKVGISTGSHTMHAAHPFGIYVYGFGSFDSYGYPGGLALEVISGP